MSNDKITIPLERALKVMPDTEYVHTFRSGGLTLLGADWERSKLIEAMGRADEIEIGGDACKSINHGLVFFDDAGAVFVEGAKDTDWEALEASLAKES